MNALIDEIEDVKICMSCIAYVTELAKKQSPMYKHATNMNRMLKAVGGGWFDKTCCENVRELKKDWGTL